MPAFKSSTCSSIHLIPFYSILSAFLCVFEFSVSFWQVPVSLSAAAINLVFPPLPSLQ